jgi:hypothetical protein
MTTTHTTPDAFSRDGHPVKIIRTWTEQGIEFAEVRYLDGHLPHQVNGRLAGTEEAPTWEHRVKDGQVVRSGGDYYNPADWELERGLACFHKPNTHRMTWWVYAGGKRIRYENTMRGSWGWDATCSCGWDSKLGGGTNAAVKRAVADHKRDVAQDTLADHADGKHISHTEPGCSRCSEALTTHHTPEEETTHMTTPKPRTKTRSSRADDVQAAVASLPTLIATAVATEAKLGADDPTTLAAWEAVEVAGAIVHRQGRLLAGKSKGG